MQWAPSPHPKSIFPTSAGGGSEGGGYRSLDGREKRSPRGPEDRLLIKLLPLLGLVEHQGGIDELERRLERRLDFPAGGRERAAGQDLLAVADQEIIKQDSRVRMRRVAREPLRGRA